MRSSILAFILLSLIGIGCSNLKPLNSRINKFNGVVDQVQAFPPFNTAGLGFYAVDLNSGEIVAEVNPDMALRPASTQKLLTTATAFEVLGPEYRFQTNLLLKGEVDILMHYLKGDIVVRGGGDPTLGSKYFDTINPVRFIDEFVAELKNRGIDSISGRVVSDARIYSWDMVPPSWSWQNMGNYFGAGACGLTVFDNYFSLLFDTYHFGEPAKVVGIYPNIPDLILDNRVVADSISYDNVNIYGAPYSNRRLLRGELPINKKRFVVKGSMPDPALVAAMQLDSALKANNFVTHGLPTTVRRLIENGEDWNDLNEKEIYTIESPILSEIVSQTNIHSINLFAEHCLMQTGLSLGSKNNILAAADSMVSFWEGQGMDTRGLSVNDGSGLSQYDAITPRQMVFLLDYMKNISKYHNEFYHSMAVAGQSGTVKNMFRGSYAEGNMHIKSGTITRVKAYAGYVQTASGREVAFSVVVNNFSCSSREAKNQLEQLMIALSAY